MSVLRNERQGNELSLHVSISAVAGCPRNALVSVPRDNIRENRRNEDGIRIKVISNVYRSQISLHVSDRFAIFLLAGR